jgi:primosomal protein N' (replication factor Y)
MIFIYSTTLTLKEKKTIFVSEDMKKQDTATQSDGTARKSMMPTGGGASAQIIGDGPHMFAEVILPLPLATTFTYRVPTGLEQQIHVGTSVVVPFGRKKMYTAIVCGMTPRPPEGFEVKDIITVLKPYPILRHPQLKLWEWISEYYLCSIGDVMKAALPAGLKVESETFVEINPDYEETGERRLSEAEAVLLQTVDHHGRISVAELEHKTGIANTTQIVARLVSRHDALIVSEKLVERYRAKRETLVTLAFPYDDSDAMHRAFDSVQSAKKQEQMLITLVDMLNKKRHNGQETEVLRSELLTATGLSTAIVSALAAKGIISISTREVNRFQFTGVASGTMPKLTEPQMEALDRIHLGFLSRNVVLLHGVTSSGKTELYIHLINFILQKGEQVLYLVPEIALTTQLTRRLQRVFGDKVVIYHSKFSDNERVDIWEKLLRDSSPCVVIGARSSLFLPFTKLGLVIVDEEHESSYKQYDPAPRYNARDTAIVLASMHGAKTLLGSATPAVETYYKANTSRYGLVELSERYEGAKLPEIEIVDMLDEKKRGRTTGSPLSMRLLQLTREAVGRGEQVILFHNRRGFAPVVMCKQCAYVPKCQYCDVSLTYHRRRDEMVCHYCGATYRLPSICPSCKEPSIEVFGYGTERLEDIADNAFGDAKVLRMDLDTTRNKEGYDNIISDFSAGKAQILVGTQMVTKGLDFGGVSLVGVLSADALINFPDFRSAERAFNMLEQVSGRAGRRTGNGRVVVQTTQPEHPLIARLRNHDYKGFYSEELEQRRLYNYPPFTRVINIYLKHRDLNVVNDASARYAARLHVLFGNRVFGPEEPHVSRVQSLYIRKIMLKVEIEASMSKVKNILRSVYEEFMVERALRSMLVYYDVDPM